MVGGAASRFSEWVRYRGRRQSLGLISVDQGTGMTETQLKIGFLFSLKRASQAILDLARPSLLENDSLYVISV